MYVHGQSEQTVLNVEHPGVSITVDGGSAQFEGGRTVVEDVVIVREQHKRVYPPTFEMRTPKCHRVDQKGTHDQSKLEYIEEPGFLLGIPG